MATRDEFVRAVSERYGQAGRVERGRILDEFAAVTGLHRKHAMRLLRGGTRVLRCSPRPGRRVYDVAVREALIVVWEASDRVCGKRLRPLVPLLIEAMERHRHLQRLQGERPGLYPDSLLRTLQRRLKGWRRDVAHQMLFGSAPATGPVPVLASSPSLL